MKKAAYTKWRLAQLRIKIFLREQISAPINTVHPPELTMLEFLKINLGFYFLRWEGGQESAFSL